MKKGFTLIELLAVIVILAIIALIIVPIVSNVVDSSRKAAFRESVNGIIDSTNNYLSEYVLSHNDELKDYPVVFTCDGISCTNGEYQLTFKGTVPKGGSVIIYEEGVMSSYITDGKYCAYGYKWDMQIGHGCGDVDMTKPTIEGVLDAKTLKLTMSDDGSGIYGYCVTKNDNCNYIKSSEYVEHTLDSMGLYKAYAKDNRGNISEALEFNVNDIFEPSTPTGGSIGDVAGSNTVGTIAVEASGSTDDSGNVTYKYLVTNDSTIPDKNDERFGTDMSFARSCGTSYYAWAVAEDGEGNRSNVYSMGSTSDGANSYSEYGTCSKTCGGGTQTRTNTCALITTGLSQSCNTQSCCTFTSKDFGYTGNIQSWTVPAGCAGTYKLEVWGAQGGSVSGGAGGKGGYSYGKVSLTNGKTIYVAVGGAGSGCTKGYNGGGGCLAGAHVPSAGGGATHIATTNRGVLANYNSYRSEVLIVAAGGGGGYRYDSSASSLVTAGGAGGGTNGGNGCWEGTCGGGATQTTGGSGFIAGTFGQGHNPTTDYASGGGGGWFGGGGGYGSGAGGSGYIGGVTGGSTTAGQRAGNGMARISLESLN